MFKRMELDDAEYQLKPMNCPFHILIYRDQHAELSRPARAAGRARHGLSVRAFGRHARPAARPRLHPGRRAHFLHARADRGRSGGLPASSPAIRCTPTASTITKPSSPPGTAARAGSTTARRNSGRSAEGALQKALERVGMKAKVIAGRSRVLRPENRREARGRDRAARGSSPPSSSISHCRAGSASSTSPRTVRRISP